VLKVVVDTNVVVSGTILDRGNPYEILEAWRRQDFTLVLSAEIVSEIEAVLRRPKLFKKYALTETLVARLISAFEQDATTTSPVSIDPIPGIESADLKFLACAAACDADYFVTGDQKPLDLETHKGTRIVSPRAFLTILRES
jgi:putative PIN family toxin of toxin-antitoxin system